MIVDPDGSVLRFLQDPVPALWIDSYRWFVHDDKLWLVGNTAGNVESSKKTAGQFSGTFFFAYP